MRGTAVLAAAVASRERKPRVFVSGSAIGYYGNRGDEVLTEQSAPGDDFLAEVCVAWEAETQPAADAGVRTVLTRTGIVLDAGGGALARMLLPFKLGIGGRQGSGKQWMSWIALADEVGAIRHAIEHDVGARAGQPRRPEPGHQRRLRAHARPGVAPADDPARRRCCPLKLRFGAELVESLLLASQRVAPAQLAADGLRVHLLFTRRCAPRHVRGLTVLTCEPT